jgi:glutaredoxin 3
MQAKIVIYTKANCPYCVWAKQLLDNKQATYQELRIDLDEKARADMDRLSGGRRTVPQIFINDQLIGGFDDLSMLEKAGNLDNLLHLNKEK